MAPLFAPQDIGYLISAFPPAAPKRGRPSLIHRTSDRELLVDSRTILADFEKLLSTATTRIRIEDLASRLRILNADWALDVLDGDLSYSKDHKFIVPRAELKTTHQALLQLVSSDVLDLGRLGFRYDLSPHSVLRLIDSELKDGSLIIVTAVADDRRQWISSAKHLANLDEAITNLVKNAQAEEILELSQHFNRVPRDALYEIGGRTVDHTDFQHGKLEVRDDVVVFIPPGHADARKAHEEALQRQQVDDLISQLPELGFCLIPNGELLRNVEQACKDSGTVTPWTVIGNPAHSGIDKVAICGTRRLSLWLDAVCDELPKACKAAWTSRSNADTAESLRSSLVAQLLAKWTESEPLTKLILSSEHRERLERVASDELVRLLEEENKVYRQTVQESILTPLDLYSTAIEAVADSTLKEHLEQFCGDHARRELVPGGVKSLRDHHLLIEKARLRAVEKFEQAVGETKSLSETRTAAQKFARKQKIDSPSTTTLKRVQADVMKRNLKAMRSMSRGSDVLQNLLWILLGCKTNGLYLSSGKDTSRMIKHFGAVGDEQTRHRLEQWRDALKSEQDTPDDIQHMRELAASCLEAWSVREEANGSP